jgi:hypothetical protein
LPLSHLSLLLLLPLGRGNKLFLWALCPVRAGRQFSRRRSYAKHPLHAIHKSAKERDAHTRATQQRFCFFLSQKLSRAATSFPQPAQEVRSKANAKLSPKVALIWLFNFLRWAYLRILS